MASHIRLIRHLFLGGIVAFPLSLICSQTLAPAPQLDHSDIERRVTSLLNQMTLEEKVGQLVHFADSSTGPGAPHQDIREQIAEGNVGSLENITGTAETNALQNLAIEKSRLHYSPALRIGHNPRVSHYFPGTLGDGLDLGPVFSRTGLAYRRQRGHRRGYPLDLLVHG